jgi:hypothetical protein
MKIVSTTGLMLGMLAITALAGTAFLVGPSAYAQPTNAAVASATRGDNIQSNYADVYQSQTQKCKANAESENENAVQVGDNTNTAANNCGNGNTQSSSVSQTNQLTDNSVQAATARACQVLAGLGAANFGC